MNTTARISTGIDALDEKLGGGLLPGTLTLVVGATGIGKTQLGVQYANAGKLAESNRGIFFDMTARGDSQSHLDYAKRIFDWDVQATTSGELRELSTLTDLEKSIGEYLRVFDYQGRRINRRDADEDVWRQWQSQLNERLAATIAFMYGNFVRGVRRLVIDGIEPVDDPGDSIQYQLFEYIYHQLLQKEHDWVARDLFRQNFREHSDWVANNAYDPSTISSMMLCTSHETMLDDMIARPLHEGDLLSGANTIIFMGKIKSENSIGRALHIAKHRGSACSEEIIPFRITETGIELR